MGSPGGEEDTKMTPFMTEDFLLDTEFSRRLYHDYAKDQPIFDYHCHLPPQQIAGELSFQKSV
ncbi:uronate isomerase [Klebsiella michiganensis]|uniref:Uronate isomerase n=1 Tax=Klebsiella michiganensis TaxID=1134687 RepID=A0A7H4PHF3_9ENTR|nr:uronate isomerase [Klebsiella michiganensis]